MVVTVFVLLLNACSEMPLVSNPSDREAGRLEIDLATTSLYTGEQTPLRWKLFDQNDEEVRQLPAWMSPSWSSSSPIVRVADGNVEPLQPGDATITLRLGGVSASRSVRINPGALATKIEAAYITQAVQRLDASVPLVRGRPGFLRVFVTGDKLNYFKPTMRARFFLNGTQTAQLSATMQGTGIPTSVDEGTLLHAWIVPVPGALIEPGASLLVEVMPDGDLRPASTSVLRHPASGVAAPLDVRVIPTFRITFVPIHIINFATGDVSASNVDYYMAASREVWPFRDTDVIVREPYSTNTRSLTDDDWSDLLLETRLLRTADGSSRYYHGILRREGSWSGLGYVNFPTAISRDGASTWTVAHELGHNFGRRHAPCGGPSGVDTGYPHAGGGIGVFGIEASGVTLHAPSVPDLMTYCAPRWVSDYSYMGVINKLQTTASPQSGLVSDSPAPVGTMLMVSGELGSARARLNPAFTLETVASLPSEAGPYTLRGMDASGVVLFTYSFAGEELGDGPVSVRQFAFAIPLAEAQAARLARLTVQGAGEFIERSASSGAAADPAGGVAAGALSQSVIARAASADVVSLSWDSARFPVVAVRNPATGALLAIARNGQATVRTSASALDLHVSDGVKSFVERVVVR